MPSNSLIIPRLLPTRAARCSILALTLLLAAHALGDTRYDFSDEPLLASAVSDKDVELRGRYVRQWQQDDVHILMYTGGFRLDMGRRQFSADNAVVWVQPRQDSSERPFWEFTIYLAQNAEVREAADTVTVDNVLLVRGLRTYGQIIKYQDAHSAEPGDNVPLYQQAVRDRELIEAGDWPGGDATPRVVRPAELDHLRTDRPPRAIRYRLPNVEPAQTASGEPVFVSTGGVYLAQDGGPDAAMLEIRAQNAVVFPRQDSADALLGTEPAVAAPEAEAPEPDRPATGEVPPAPRGVAPPATVGQPTRPDRGGGGLASLGPAGAGGRIRAVYLEGDVVLSMGSRFVRAHRLYYDFERERALILDAVFRAEIPQRGVPLYVRADEMRQLSAREFAAENAKVTTSEFHTPSYHIGAERIVLRDATVRDPSGRATGPVAGSYEMSNTTLNVRGVPMLWWPYSAGTLQESETLLRGISTGYSGDLGAKFESSWYLMNLLGVKPPEGFDATLELDYFSRRGPAVGINADYERETHYGLFRGYYIHDDGEDNLGPLRRAAEEPTTHERGRVLWRHRHYLPHDWELTLEASYISDDNFLEEYERSEFEEGKEQETLAYLKRVRGVEAITLLANVRLLDYLTQTEHLPDVMYRRIGDTFLSPFVLYHESRLGMLRYLPDDRRYFDRRRFNNDGRTDLTFRSDARQEVELPIKLGPLKIAPFATVRGSYWGSQPLDDGGLWRGMGVYGARGSAIFSRVYEDLESELLDIHRIRHIIQPEFVSWWAHSNTRSELITPFDYGIETIDDFYGFMAGIRQTWQTKRGPADDRRTVDLLKFNIEVGLFGDVHGRNDISNGYVNPLRPENSRTRNYLAGDLIHRISDTTSLLYDFNVDLNDMSYDRHNVSLAIERSPRLAYVLGTRYAGDIDMSLVGGGWNYKINQKHITSVRVWWDVDVGELGEVAVVYVRKLPRWYLGMNFEYDNVDDDVTVSLSLWPEGIPEWALGSRRFTGLGTSTGIRP